MKAIFNKEFKSFFNHPIGYIFMGVFLLISGLFFTLYNLLPNSSYYIDVLNSITFVFLFLVPILTMRSIADETKERTDQLLLTSPLKVWKIVVGKYLASILLFFITLLITGIYPIILSFYSDVAMAPIITAYIGFGLMGAAFISVGVFISSLTDNQVTAAVGTFGALLIIWILDWVIQVMPTSRAAGIVLAVILVCALTVIIYYSTKNIYISGFINVVGIVTIVVINFVNVNLFEGFTARFFQGFSLLKRYEPFVMGLLNVSSIVYYITFSTAFIFLTIRIIDKRRWS